MAIRALDGQPLSLGIDIGGTKAHGVVLDAGDHVLAEVAIPTEPQEAGIRRTVLAVAGTLASELGITRESFSRVLASLEKHGIRIDGQTIWIDVQDDQPCCCLARDLELFAQLRCQRSNRDS